ncbi:ABC transporter permease [Methanolapillus millepedarum]|uniref:Macrolide export ATP-binding/permease protein MacB n=1 Tax=Methanolapillus millepedarum TaxID=3028296 RepID=A0AA96ZWL4_9EURY|nr:Macrolide export ATP-binding/permease protein MacB [Methanosarcinaceae archaeon Ac7]
MISVAHSSKMALESLKSSKMRSLLTALGIIIGIAAVVTTFTFGSSFGTYMNDQISSDGSNYLTITATKDNIFHDQQVGIVANTSGVSSATPTLNREATLKFMGESKNYSVMGTKEDYVKNAQLPIYEGNYFTDKDSNAIVIGKDIANDGFRNKISTRSTIELTFYDNETQKNVTKKFKVVGIIGEDNSSLVGNAINSNMVVIPIETLQELTGKDYYQTIYTVTDSKDDVNKVSDDVKERLAKSVGVSDRELKEENNSKRLGGDKIPFYIFNQADLLEQVGKMSKSLELFISAIGGISLVVGSIGIMNIMLVTVTERTKEIGTLKALGYSYRDILSLFIVESVIISAVGGAIGTVAGLSIANIGANFLGYPIVVPISTVVIGILVSVAIGIFAGVYPANKAAKMNPVDALRQE